MITLLRYEGQLTGRCAVAVRREGTGLHAGVIYDAGGGEHRFLHLLFAGLQDETVPEGVYWVVPSLTPIQTARVAVWAGVLAESYPFGNLPWGLAVEGVGLIKRDVSGEADEAWMIDLGGRAGLSCSSLIQVLFSQAGVPLIRLDTYLDERSFDGKREDMSRQDQLLGQLAFVNPKQAAAARADIGHPYIRAEEVAGASGLPDIPVGFSAAEAAGLDVLQALP